MSWYRDQLEAYIKTLDIKADRVLDVGGAALPVKDRVKSWDVNKYRILDNLIEKSKLDNLPDFMMDLNKMWGKEGNTGTGEQYDIVFCLEVMEYIFNPYRALFNIWKTLKLNGVLYITFPFLYPTHEPKENDFLRYTQAGVLKLLTENNFKIEECVVRAMKPGSHALWKAFIKSEGMHAVKGLAHIELGVIIKAIKI